MKNPVALVKDLAARLTGAQTAIQDLHAAETALRQAHDAAEAERTRILSARPPRVDVIAAAERQVDAIRAAWILDNGTPLVNAIAGYMDVSPNGEVRGVVTGDLLSAPGLTGGLDARTLMALAPDAVKQGLRAIIGATDYAEGPAMEDRPRLVAELNAKRAGFVQEHAELVDNALAVGITLEHLPATVGQRALVAQAHERWARDQVANRAYYKNHPSARPPEPEGAP